MLTKLQQIAKVSKEKPKERFTSLMHTVNNASLKRAHEELKANKATGIDGKTKTAYGVELEKNIDNLLCRMKKFQYRPNPVKRVYIPKENGKKRPLGIPSYEDKLVQHAMNKTLNAIYESDFLECSCGFRESRNCHQALKVLNYYIEEKDVNYIVDVDIKGFFDNIDHKWMMKFLEHRIQDKNFLRYITRFLKSGIMERGTFHKSHKGAPQGGIISPTLGNIYLHYVIDLWFEKKVKKELRRESHMVRYADDVVCAFQNKKDADEFYNLLIERLAKFGLEASEEKTKIIFFGKSAYYKSRFQNK